MQIVRTVKEMQQIAGQFRLAGKKIGFVPTMGYLHNGHLSLMDIARPKCDVLVVSIFVNPTQFGPNEDLDKYPRDFENDEKLCRERNVDIIYYPETVEMYPKPYFTFITTKEITEPLCGEKRPGHFDGVTTVVGKLFNIVKPHFAVFGSKDYQQALVIKTMVKDLNFDIEIITGEIIRESDGLAMSSRNKYLSADERKSALILSQSLKKAQQMLDDGINDAAEILEILQTDIQNTPHCKIDYVEIVDSQTLRPLNKIKTEALLALAVFVGSTRLIDNCILTVKN